ncbi:hypothetical protein D6D12_08825 [Aureobasidium pullulans]|uniref:BZIP domain-containing protein n=1 Tax=Aureobasidium pullulans TaxID=5580 RepID=A0AB74JJU5_AURPU|nr:hypothetical protein D6D12_08825 [Aureobasidium pullulans]THX39073.1 hypothetical protein D6D11_08913 [Aureobasidium pullulans]
MPARNAAAEKVGKNQAPIATDKKVRNRLSQQAFRERQAAYVRNLEKQVENIGQTNDERVLKLEAENRELRKQLLAIRQKLESVTTTLSGISKAAAAAASSDDSATTSTSFELDPKALMQTTETLPTTLDPPNNSSQPQTQNWVVETTSSRDVEDIDTSGSLWSGALTASTSFNVEPQYTQRDQEANHQLMQSSPYVQLPHVWSHSYQMGVGAYVSAMSKVPDLDITMLNAYATNSRFSDHFAVIKQCFSSVLANDAIIKNVPGLTRSASIVFSLFHSIARPTALSWYTTTKSHHHVANVIAWQIYPCRETYAQITTRYKPTALQIMEHYPSVIDWCPYASMRDRLITAHSANPFIDNIIIDMATAYVVESTLDVLSEESSLPLPCFVRVWDIIQAMNAPASSSTNKDTQQNLPAPNTASLFTPNYARLVFSKLEMTRGMISYKLDPVFFSKYPELFDQEDEIVAKGLPLYPEQQVCLPSPLMLNQGMLETYRHFSSWALDVLVDRGSENE